MKIHFPRNWIDDLFNRVDIVELVSEYVPLNKRGANYWALCPFHNEKTPSFSVNREQSLYYCFGCGKGGGAVQFVMEMEKLTFPEALEYLAGKCQLALPANMSYEDEQASSLRERLYELNQEAAKYYHNLLWTDTGAAVLKYFRNRGIDDGTIRRFGLGASSDSWDSISDAMQEKGYTTEELVKAGIIAQKENHSYDVFRGRAMFPILNMYGKVLGFGGRIIGDGQPKYLNTSDTAIFNKRYGVYGANLLRKQRRLERILLVEGYMDVISLSQAGIQGAVATLGTALTSEQARFMKRFSEEIHIAYDGDEAGQRATERAIEILRGEGLTAKVLSFPDELDPDSFIRERGVEAFNELKPLTDIEFTLNRIKSKTDISTQDGRLTYANKAAEILALIKSPLELETYLKKLCLETGFSTEALMAQIKIAGSQLKVKYRSLARGEYRRSTAQVKPKYALSAEEELLSILSSKLLPEGFLSAEDFISPLSKTIASELLDNKYPAIIISQLDEEDERNWAARLFSKEHKYNEESALSAAESCLSVLQRARLEKKIDELNERLKLAEDYDRQSIITQLQEATMQLTEIKSK